MSQPDFSRTSTCHEQVYLIERDAGLLCRILGLYAARAIDVLHVDYAFVAQEVMKLRVRTAYGKMDPGDTADSVRTLLAKVSTLVGVIAAAEQPGDVANRHPAVEA